MNNEELIEKMKQVKSNLENAKKQLNHAQEILNDSITFNNKGFKCDEILLLNSKLDRQINNLNDKIIPKINNV